MYRNELIKLMNEWMSTKANPGPKICLDRGLSPAPQTVIIAEDPFGGSTIQKIVAKWVQVGYQPKVRYLIFAIFQVLV